MTPRRTRGIDARERGGRMMDARFIDPREAVWIASGAWFDAIGSMRYVDLPRNQYEPDHEYRHRLITRLFGAI